jgi:hypothetical protein
MKISLNQQIDEVERELEMRRKVYPAIKGSQAKKDYQMQRLQAVLETLQWLKHNEPQIRGMLEGDNTERGEN